MNIALPMIAVRLIIKVNQQIPLSDKQPAKLYHLCVRMDRIFHDFPPIYLLHVRNSVVPSKSGRRYDGLSKLMLNFTGRMASPSGTPNIV